MSDPQEVPSPINNVPPAILALTALVIGIEILFLAGTRGIIGGPQAEAWRVLAVTDFGFAPRLWAFMGETGQWSFDGVARVVSYAFLNQSFVSAVFACVFILAFGKFVGDVIGGARALLIYLVSAAGAAVLYGTVFPDQGVLVGSFPGAYGLLGAYTFILFLSLEHANENKLQAFRLVGVLAALQLVFGVIFAGPPWWLADLGGAGIGFLTAAAMAPGGLLRWIRRR
ncbi:MAG: rhomboid family intramembrane serine protease [Pseudomonadota bacterium]